MWKITAAILLILPSSSLVNGHGYMYSPRSRNWIAYEDGTDSWSPNGSAGTPVAEYCYHCLNSKAADEVCGRTQTANYDEWLDINGDPIPWNSQETYIEGQIISVKSYLNAHHKGHMDLMLCPDGENPTQECFEANPVEFVEDAKHGAPKDVNYPERGYYASGVQDFEFKYKLPMGITGDRILMQWRYVTGNSCIAPGYLDYPWPNQSWLGADHRPCSYPLDPTGDRCTGCPEQFWNCAEVTIQPNNGQPTPPPVPSPTLAPVMNPIAVTSHPSSPVAAPTPGGVGCCSRDFKNCNQQLEGWCSESKENCEGSCMKWWLPNGAVGGDCIARYEGCSSAGSCCGPLICKQGQCTLDSPNYPTKTSAPVKAPSPVKAPTPVANPPTPPPTTSPVWTGNYCCSFDYKTCSQSSWCNESQSNCGSCNGYWTPDNPSKQCNALYTQCDSHSDCCGPANCAGNGYKQCEPGNPPPTVAPVPPPTSPPVNPPTLFPTKSPTVPEGCYSINYKDCLPPNYISGDESCQEWLPTGARNNCIDLGGECTNNESSCCGPARCVGDNSYAACLPPEGCYSINYKDCLPPTYALGDESCKVWLPTGARNNCVSLGEECTGNESSCCGSSKCVGDNSYASCLPS